MRGEPNERKLLKATLEEQLEVIDYEEEVRIEQAEEAYRSGLIDELAMEGQIAAIKNEYDQQRARMEDLITSSGFNIEDFE